MTWGIIIPIELRRQRRIRRGVRLEVTLEGDRVVLRRHGPFCVFCDSAEDLRPFPASMSVTSV